MIGVSDEFVFTDDGRPERPRVTGVASTSHAPDGACSSVSLLDLTMDSQVRCSTIDGEGDDDASEAGIVFPRVLVADQEDFECSHPKIMGSTKGCPVLDKCEPEDSEMVIFTGTLSEKLDVEGTERRDDYNQDESPFNLDESHIIGNEDDVNVAKALEVETSLIVGGPDDAVETSLIVAGADESEFANSEFHIDGRCSQGQDKEDRIEVQQSFTTWADGVMEASLLSTSVQDVTESFVESLCVSNLDRSCGNGSSAEYQATDGPCSIVSPCGLPTSIAECGSSCTSGTIESSLAGTSAIWHDMESILGSACQPTRGEISTFRSLREVGFLGDAPFLAGLTGESTAGDDVARSSAVDVRNESPRRKRRIRNRAGEATRVRAEQIRRLRMRGGDRDSLRRLGTVSSRRTNRMRARTHTISRAWSMDDQEIPSLRLGHTKSTKDVQSNSFSEHKSNPTQLGRVIGDCLNPKISFEEGNGILQAQSRHNSASNDSDDVSLCYDSDPGEVTTRLTAARRKDTHKEDAEVMDISLKSSEEDHSKEHGQTDLNDASAQRNTLMSVMDKSDAGEIAVLLSVQETLNKTLHLNWHQSAKADDDSCKNRHDVCTSPRCVRIWFERGYSIGHGRSIRLIEPKVVWRDVMHEVDDSTNYQNTQSTGFCGQFALLDVCRVLHTSTASVGDGALIDRRKYPTARSSCSFIVRTVDNEEFLFEAKTEDQRNIVLHQWKVAIARLASIVIVENSEAMKKEFFLPQSFLGVAEPLFDDEFEVN
mmetsp:Transcript_12734/g.37471  ORF Transcript_12734/g.37471 Transcript_12734/m.37471 type:complete len:766 (-) Transcript_12734:403-2700(-)|eukprot:CAMPEP_0113532314 /NCGR_PEP_ID=MMETSP0015_2-20120614/3990_1 /TAXON_ID=2838 /ORGANISM="Odontella" /LENGTH=765 /DNA_ID=CAMNT_0000431261 /DNA_START=94 /DNA_END=2391 /DNA_ORIENTATION=+ /assembly_acc=CAM_ASM_000160